MRAAARYNLFEINFQIFYWSHILYIFYWIILILHSPDFWKWFIVPCILFLIEKIYRVGNSLSEKGKSYVTMGIVLPSKVIQRHFQYIVFPCSNFVISSQVISLVIKRPPHFAFKPGDYLFINIPAIATFEWHPFTISSAPEQTDEFSLHIRVVGHWTSKLFEYFQAEQRRLEFTMKGEAPEVSTGMTQGKHQFLLNFFMRCVCVGEHS
jgi:predicted ferric reductase